MGQDPWPAAEWSKVTLTEVNCTVGLAQSVDRAGGGGREWEVQPTTAVRGGRRRFMCKQPPVVIGSAFFARNVRIAIAGVSVFRKVIIFLDPHRS